MKQLTRIELQAGSSRQGKARQGSYEFVARLATAVGLGMSQRALLVVRTVYARLHFMADSYQLP